MSLRNSEYFCVEEPPTATIDDKQHSLNPMALARATNYLLNEHDESPNDTPTFMEDFLLEHSPIGQQADSIEFAVCF